MDDAIKVTILGTTDGIAILAYAGLGATAMGTQPSEWMSAVLRGRRGLTMAQALGVLAEAATRELPRHLGQLPGHFHSILATAFVDGVGPRIFTIDNQIDPRTGEHRYRFVAHEYAHRPGSPPPRVALAGTGGIYLSTKGRRWRRGLLDLVNAHDHGKISDLYVADQLAALNDEAHRNLSDGTVGDRCIVVWRRRTDEKPKPSFGGGHKFYTGRAREKYTLQLPTVGNGMDVTAIIGVLIGFHEEGFGLNGPDIDPDELNRRTAQLPTDPDERLR